MAITPVAPPGFILASNASATGTAVKWPGGKGMLTVYSGAWGGGTVKLQVMGPDGSNYVDVDATNATFTNNGLSIIELAPCYVRINIATSTGVYASLSPFNA